MLRMNASDTLDWLASTDPIPVRPLDDPVVLALGHRAESEYAETYWLPIIGPTALWALRRLNRWLEDAPDGFPLVVGPFARELGLGLGVGRNSPAVRSLARLAKFHIADIRRSSFYLRRFLPPLAHWQLKRLPDHLAAQHELETHRDQGAVPHLTDRDFKVAGGRAGLVGEAGLVAHRRSASHGGAA